MKSYSCALGPIKLFQTKEYPAGLGQARRGLTVLLLVLGLALAWLSPAAAWDGAVDTTFNTGSGDYAGVQIIPVIRGQLWYPYFSGPPASQYNNFSLLYGNFYAMTVGTETRVGHNSICRLTNTGALDPSFVSANIYGEVRGAYIYPHNDLYNADKILIWGNFNAGSGSQYFPGFVRLNPDGQIDPSFPQVFYNGTVNTVMVQGSGLDAKILVGGYDLRVGDMDGPSYHLVRLNYDCRLDDTFTPWGAPGGYITSIKPDAYSPVSEGKVRIFLTYPKNPDSPGGIYYMLLLTSAVTFPSQSNPALASLGDETVDGPIYNISRQSDGKWMICGQFKKAYDPNAVPPGWVTRNRVARLLSNGTTLDTTYDVGTGPHGSVTQIVPMNSVPGSYDDRMVVTGGFDTWNGASCGYLVRLNTEGALDGTFAGGTRADDRIRALYWNNGGGGTIYGYFRSYNGQDRGGIAALDPNGNLITSGPNSYAGITAVAGNAGTVYSLATQKDGKIIIGGDFNGVCGKYRDGLARINPDGSLDPSFTGGVDGIVRSVAVQADGNILVGGTFGQCQGFACTSLARVKSNSYLDTTFKPMLVGYGGGVNRVYQVVPLAGGKVMIAGELWGTVNGPAARLNSNGTPDPSFDASGFPMPEADWYWGSRIAMVGSKWIIAGGYSIRTGGEGGFLARLNSNGGLDNDFGPPALSTHIQTTDGRIDDLLLQPDGKIVVSGMFSHITYGSMARSAIARFSADGWLDPTFTPSLTPPGNANTIALAAMALQPNGKILIEANFLQTTGDYNSNYIGTQVARLNSNGSLDLSFSLGTPGSGYFSPWNGGNSILRLPTGKALIGGNFRTYNGTPAFSLVRIFAGPAGFNPGTLYMLLLNAQ